MENRSGKFNASLDPYIFELLADPLYHVTPDGHVLTRVAPTGKVYKDPNKWRRTGSENGQGYIEVKYHYQSLSLHRIVYAAHVAGVDGAPPLEQDMIINHKDGIRSNCHPTNLESLTQSKNIVHRYTDLKRGAVIGNAVLNWEKVRAIRADRISGMKYAEIAAKYDISKGHVSEIVNNKIWIEGYEYSPASQQRLGA